MQPHQDIRSIRYATSSDGYSIAYCVSGEGMPLVFMPSISNHVQLVWTPGTYQQPWLSALSSRFRLVQYDGRGQGLSSRNLPGEYSLDALELDLTAVVEHLQLDRFILLGCNVNGHAAVRFAVKHPNRVVALILGCCSVSGRFWPVINALDLALNWDLFPGICMAAMRAPSPELRQVEIDLFRQSVTQSDWLIMARTWATSNIGDIVPSLETPTLVLHARGYENMAVERSIDGASRIPNARFVLLDGLLELGDVIGGMQAIESFMRELPSGGEPSQNRIVQPETEPALLSQRQSEVLRLIAEGKTTREIAERLFLSERTVQRHIADVYDKIGARNRAEATANYLSRGASVHAG